MTGSEAAGSAAAGSAVAGVDAIDDSDATAGSEFTGTSAAADDSAAAVDADSSAGRPPVVAPGNGKFSGAERSAGASSPCSAGMENMPASSASVVNRFIIGHPPARYWRQVSAGDGRVVFSSSARTVQTRSVRW